MECSASACISLHVDCAGVLGYDAAHSFPSVNLMSNWLTRADEAKTKNRTTSHTQSVCGGVQVRG